MNLGDSMKSDAGNFTGNSTHHKILIESTESILIPILFFFIFVVGILGNGTLIFTVFRNSNMRSVPNALIVNLAVGDIMLILVAVPFTSTLYTLMWWPYGFFVCKLKEGFTAISLGVSVFTLVALSFDRYVAITMPLRNRQRGTGKTRRRIVILISVIWLASLLLSVPLFMNTNIKLFKDVTGEFNEPVCMKSNQRFKNIWTIFSLIVYFLLPMIIIASCYIMMARALMVKVPELKQATKTKLRNKKDYDNSPLNPEVAPPARNQQKKRNKVAKVVLSFVVIFVICWLPIHIVRIMMNIVDVNYNLYWHLAKITSLCLSFTNSCVNPFALYLMSKKFRYYFDKYLFCSGSRIDFCENTTASGVTCSQQSTMRSRTTLVSSAGAGAGAGEASRSRGHLLQGTLDMGAVERSVSAASSDLTPVARV